MALLLAFLGDVSPGHSSGISVLNVLILVVVGIALLLVALGVVLALRKRRR